MLNTRAYTLLLSSIDELVTSRLVVTGYTSYSYIESHFSLFLWENNNVGAKYLFVWRLRGS